MRTTGVRVDDVRLEWSSPAGAAEAGELARLAGPWRRHEHHANVEVFCVHLGVAADGPRKPDPRPIVATAASRLRLALERPGAPWGLLEDACPPLAASDVTTRLVELWRRAIGPARVETGDGERLWLRTMLGAAGPIAVHLVGDASPATIASHTHAVAAALRTRLTLTHAARAVQELATTLTAARRVSLERALPLAWRHLQQLLDPTGD